METFIIKAVQLIMAFALLVVIHEFGHFLFARMFGVKVEKFYIFFNPWTSIFKWKPKKYVGFFNKKKMLNGTKEGEEDTAGTEENKKRGFWNDTEYGLGWVPLGGYCKIAGMVDESMDTEQLKKEPQPWEFRTKPAWQRLLIMIAGVLFNFLLAILIYAGIVYATGEKYVPFNEAEMGMTFSPEAHKIGFRDGDIPLAADGEALDFPADARIKMIEAKKVTVLRGADTVAIAIPDNFMLRLDKESKRADNKFNFMTYRFPTRISQVQPGGGASKAGLKEGDEIVAVNGKPTPSLMEFFTELEGHGNRTIPFDVVRTQAGRRDTLQIAVPLSESSKMGVGLETDPSAFYKYNEKNYGLFESVPRGVEMGVDKLTSYAKSMKMVFTKEGAKSVGGFGAIGSIFPESWDWIAFWNIAAFLSVALAFMNILPIPALDGGHVLFLLYEVITGRKPSDKFLEWAQMIGMSLLILLLLYANGMDIVRLFIK